MENRSLNPKSIASALTNDGSPVPQELDLKLLTQFARLVDAGGFRAASKLLNIKPSTLSSQIASLERQLGFRLCERGRSGFRLTANGRVVYDALQNVLGAVGGLERELAEARGEYGGTVTIGLVDNIASNPACRLAKALATFREMAPAVQVILKIADPTEIERSVVTGEYSMGIGVLMHKDRALRHVPLFDELQLLYCSATHPLFGQSDQGLRREDLQAYDYVARGYLYRQVPGLRAASTAWHMEAIALMVQSGAYLGHLPEHYAQRWVSTGQMRPVLPDLMGYRSQFACVTSRARRSSATVELLAEVVAAAHRDE